MVELLEQSRGGSQAAQAPGAIVVERDEAAARRTLRAQIARLERSLGDAVCGAYPRLVPVAFAASLAGPRLLSLGELERVRDGLATELARVRAEVAEQAERQEQHRVLIERMLLDPGRYHWVRVSNADIGEPGCKHWHVRPRLGPLGLLMGWWRVKISSGCPLAPGPRRAPRPRPRISRVDRWAGAAASGGRPGARMAPPTALGLPRCPRFPGRRGHVASPTPR